MGLNSNPIYFLNLLDSVSTNVDRINQDDTECSSEMEVNLTDDDLKQSSSEV